MNILKEITSSLQSNKRVYERPFRVDIDKLSQLKPVRLRSMIIELDKFCDEVLAKNQVFFSKTKILEESISNYNDKYTHLLKINSQLGEKINIQTLQNYSSNLVCESIIKIFEDNQEELTLIRKCIKNKFTNVKDKKEPVKGGEEEEEIKEDKEGQEVRDTELIVNAIKKLVLSVDKLYISKAYDMSK